MSADDFSCKLILLYMRHRQIPCFLRFPFSYSEKSTRVAYCAVETCPSCTRHTLNNLARALPGFYVFLLCVALFDPNEKNVLQFSFLAPNSALNHLGFVLALQLTQEPKAARQESVVRIGFAYPTPVCAFGRLAARPGFEPGSEDPKSFVLPLHHRATTCGYGRG